ncbi:MAG: hypothetical protein DHS20C18_38150 [Saprospiraceae bacterium]|nr:MAG: hypothetical protein DHS20C18_38150 [Saprospiraceae bacterium]
MLGEKGIVIEKTERKYGEIKKPDLHNCYIVVETMPQKRGQFFKLKNSLPFTYTKGLYNTENKNSKNEKNSPKTGSLRFI